MKLAVLICSHAALHCGSWKWVYIYTGFRGLMRFWLSMFHEILIVFVSWDFDCFCLIRFWLFLSHEILIVYVSWDFDCFYLMRFWLFLSEILILSHKILIVASNVTIQSITVLFGTFWRQKQSKSHETTTTIKNLIRQEQPKPHETKTIKIYRQKQYGSQSKSHETKTIKISWDKSKQNLMRQKK